MLVQAVIEIALAYTENIPITIQHLENVNLDDINYIPGNVILATMVTGLLGQVIFRGYLMYKMGNQTKELFSNASVIIMCIIYTVQILLVALIGVYFESHHLVGIVVVPGMALILPIQILVCHDNAWDYFIQKHPSLDNAIATLKQLLPDQENPDQDIEENAHQDMENHQDQGPSNPRNSIAKRSFKTAFNQNQRLGATTREEIDECGPKLIFVKPAP